MPKKSIYDLKAMYLRETEKAWCLKVDGHEEAVWFPKSQVEWDGDTVSVPEELLIEKELEYLV